MADSYDVVVIGAGIAGLVTTLELLEQNSGGRLLLLDRCHRYELGGLAREAFGGMFMVDTPEQRRSRIKDTHELALDDWLRVAGFRGGHVAVGGACAAAAVGPVGVYASRCSTAMGSSRAR